MAIEIETKMKLDSPGEVASRLAELGAHHVGDFFEINTFFDTPEQRLLAGGEGIRLRIARNESTGATEARLTYKGPKLGGQIKRREELESAVESGEIMADMLARLGYVQLMRFEKRRQTWELDGCEIVLDELPHLGHYIEIEGPDEAAVLRLRENLNLAHLPLISKGYASLLAQFAERHGLPKDLRF